MKNTPKQGPMDSKSPVSSESEISPQPRITPSGRTQATTGDAKMPSSASNSAMTTVFLGFEAISNRIRAHGFFVPTMNFHPRALERQGRELVFPTLISTLMIPDDLAYTWLKRFEARAMESGGVAEIKARLKFNPEAIRRWMQLKK